MLGVGRLGPRLDPSAGAMGPGEGPAAGVVSRVTGPQRGTLDGRSDGRSDEAERDAWAILASVRGLGPVTFAALIDRFGSARAVTRAASGARGGRVLLEILGDVRHRGGAIGAAPDDRDDNAGRVGRPLVSDELADRIAEAVGRGDAYLDGLRRLGLVLLTIADPTYPARLRAIEMPPPILFVLGDPAALSTSRAVAVVGTRRPSDAGRRVAGRIAGAIARAGAAVVSGLAVGIDGVAHAGAVAEHGRTVAVLGGGHARIYPHAHLRLAEAIVADGGAVISELAPDVPPSRGTFPRRNRLISGLADATVVVEAAARSGALITASWALEQGRGCFLVPGAIDAATSAGCLAFLREWAGEARIVAGIPELIEDLGLVDAPGAAIAADDVAAVGEATTAGQRAVGSTAAQAGVPAVLAELGDVERLVARALVDGRASVDDLAATTSLPVATLLGALTMLEMRGLATGAYGRYLPAGRLATLPLAKGERRRSVGAAGSGARAGFARASGRVLP